MLKINEPQSFVRACSPVCTPHLTLLAFLPLLSHINHLPERTKSSPPCHAQSRDMITLAWRNRWFPRRQERKENSIWFDSRPLLELLICVRSDSPRQALIGYKNMKSHGHCHRRTLSPVVFIVLGDLGSLWKAHDGRGVERDCSRRGERR